MSNNITEVALETDSYLDVDYHAKVPSRLLEMFDKVVIDSTCEGHIIVDEWSDPDEEGRCRKFTRYRFVPGLKLVQNTESDPGHGLPETSYILDGKPVSLQELVRGYRGVGPLVLLPASQLYDRAQRGNLKELKFDIAHLYFSKCSMNNKQTEELERRLKGLYLPYQQSIHLKIIRYTDKSLTGFYFPWMDFLVYHDYDLAIEHWIAGSNTIRRSNLSKDYGSIERYWNTVIDKVIHMQRKSWEIWEEIGALCKTILNID